VHHTQCAQKAGFQHTSSWDLGDNNSSGWCGYYAPYEHEKFNPETYWLPLVFLCSTVDHSSHCTAIETCQQCSCLQSLLRPGHHQTYGMSRAMWRTIQIPYTIYLRGIEISFPLQIQLGNEISFPHKCRSFLYGFLQGSCHCIGLIMAWLMGQNK